MKSGVILVFMLHMTSCLGNFSDIFKARPATHDVLIKLAPQYSLNISQCSNMVLTGLSAMSLLSIYYRPSCYVDDSQFTYSNPFVLLDYDHCDIFPWIIVGIIGLYKTLNAAKINPLTRINTNHDEKNSDNRTEYPEQLDNVKRTT